jgi:hypothetical protein
VTALCRHCGQEAATRPRGLGHSCYLDPAIRDLYPARKGRGPALVGATPRYTGQEPEPTPAPPGSAAKVQVLVERHARGLCLWHQADGVWVEGCRPHDRERTRGRLTPADVEEIRRLWTVGMAKHALAEEFWVTVQTIHDILTGRTHREVG